MGYLYGAMWIAAGLILLISLAKENRVFILAGGYFLLLGAWWIADALLPELDLFGGTAGIVLRVITGVVLAAAVAVFLLERRRSLDREKEKK